MTRSFTRVNVLALGLSWLLLSSVATEARVPVNAERMRQLIEVNQRVNTTITEVTDLEQYGREDVWRIPTSGKGDCEDFALLKRHMLIQRGWRASALQIAVVLRKMASLTLSCGGHRPGFARSRQQGRYDPPHQ
jgi:predicted transglutaminase-like cysteine proteinase